MKNSDDAWHDLLLAAAGRFVAEDLSEIRSTAGGLSRLGTFVAAAWKVGIGLKKADVRPLLCAAQGGGAKAAVQELEQVSAWPIPAYRFTALDPTMGPPETDDRLRSLGIRSVPRDLTATDRSGWSDQVASAVVTAAMDNASPAQGVWAVWRRRTTPNPAPMPEHSRVFLVEVADVADRVRLTRELQLAAGSPETQIEVFAECDRLPAYHLAARSQAALLAAREPAALPEVVPVFDDIDSSGPTFDPDHPRLSDAERCAVADYLYTGSLIYQTSLVMADVMDEARARVVPLNCQTDGAFVWQEAAAYYVEHHGLAPHPQLLERIRSQGYVPQQTNGVQRFRAWTALRDSWD